VAHVTDNNGYVREVTPTGQWFLESDGQRWWFDSGSVALDFAYTGGFTPKWESLLEPDALREWLHGRYPTLDDVANDRDLKDARALRGVIARMAVAASLERPLLREDVDLLNAFAATADIPPALGGGSRRAGRAKAHVGQALSAMARESVWLFDAANEERIRECAASDCHLIFYDESRSNNRRWCSMQRCGNRAKVRSHRERARGAGDAATTHEN
jgi:predicted RNA-binding Zn ribbon-like protein